jgi:two-component system nitrate/nitrite sensor histidine kinase NarX
MNIGTKLASGRTGIRLQIGTIVFLVFLIFLFEVIEIFNPNLFNQTAWSALHILTAAILAYVIGSLGIRLLNDRHRLGKHLKEMDSRQRRLHKHQQLLFQFGRDLVEADSEAKMIEQVLQLALQVTGAQGASYVPFDEREQPIAAVSRGVLVQQLMDTWAEHLATQHVRRQCVTCSRLGTEPGNDCPMLDGSLITEFPDVQHVHCLSLHCGERKVGMLTLYLSRSDPIDPEIDEFLHGIVDEAALGLEGIRLRKREITALKQLQSMRQKTDLKGTVTGLLENIQLAMESDFAVLILRDVKSREIRLRSARGNLDEQLRSFAEGVMQGVSESYEPVMMSDVASTTEGTREIRALLATPLMIAERESIGAILVGNYNQTAFTRRQLELLQTLGGHLALVVNNATLLAELEYKTMLEERTRLAREIHDGLAQTLGFLKLQVAQLQNYLKREDIERLEMGLSTSYDTLAAAYLEVRDAIDGLRVDPTEDEIQRWLQDQLTDFEEASGIHADLQSCECLSNLAPEVQVQLIRIIQEALSNIRKHAHATQVVVVCWRNYNELVIEIQDNGHGFSPEEVTRAAQYGLRGMRERADLIGADFQVISKPLEGTKIHLGIFLPSQEKAYYDS